VSSRIEKQREREREREIHASPHSYLPSRPSFLRFSPRFRAPETIPGEDTNTERSHSSSGTSERRRTAPSESTEGPSEKKRERDPEISEDLSLSEKIRTYQAYSSDVRGQVSEQDKYQEQYFTSPHITT